MLCKIDYLRSKNEEKWGVKFSTQKWPKIGQKST